MNRYRIGILCVPVLLCLVLPGCAGSGGSRLSWLSFRQSGSSLLAAGRTYETQRDFAKARNVYLELTRVAPDNWQGHHRLAVAYTVLGQHELASPCFQKARELAPDRVEVEIDFGYAQAMRNDLGGAEKTLRAVLVKAPKNVAATKQLAMVVAWQGRREEALALYRQVASEEEAHTLLAAALTHAPPATRPVRATHADALIAHQPTGSVPAAGTAAPAMRPQDVADPLQSAAASLAALQARQGATPAMKPASSVATANLTTSPSASPFDRIEPVNGEMPANPFESPFATTSAAPAAEMVDEPNPFANRERSAAPSASRFAWAEPAASEPASTNERPAWWESADSTASETAEAPAMARSLPMTETNPAFEEAGEPTEFAVTEEPAGYVSMTFEPEAEPVDEPAFVEEPALANPSAELSGYDPSLIGRARLAAPAVRSETRRVAPPTEETGEWKPAASRKPAIVPTEMPDDLPPGE